MADFILGILMWINDTNHRNYKKKIMRELDTQKVYRELWELKQNPVPTIAQKLRIQHLQQLLDI